CWPASSRASCNEVATTAACPNAANDCAKPSNSGTSVPTKRICVTSLPCRLRSQGSPGSTFANGDDSLRGDADDLDDLQPRACTSHNCNVAARHGEDVSEKNHQLLIGRALHRR